MLYQIRDALLRLLILMCICLCGAMVLVVSWQVISRFILASPSGVTEELANICFVWMGLSASALLYGEKGHMNISYIPEKFSIKNRQLLTILSEVCTLVMAVWVLSYGGWFIAKNAMGQVNAALPWLPIGVLYAIVPLTGICVVFFALCNIIQSFNILRGAEHNAPEIKA